MVDNYGAWLGRQLQRQGMTQTELAAQVNVTRAAVSTWVSGRVTPRPETVKLIEEALGVVPGASLSMDETVGHERLTWYHRPAHVDGGREYGNAAAFAFDADLSVLAREATQNSLDEILDTGRPVRIRHVLHEISGERLDAFRRVMRWDALREHYESAASAGNKASRALARALRDIEDRESLVLLRVDDYNANGLTGDDYDDGRFAAVVRRQLDSVKSNASAGGSFGLGKATLWSASSLGMVLINSTLSRPHDGHRERRLIGRIDLPWHTVGDQAYAGPAWLGEADPDRDGAARSWWADEATVEALHLERDSDEPGTSFLVVGAHQGDDEDADLEALHEKLSAGLGRNFWASMISAPGSEPLVQASVVALRDGVEVVAERRVVPDEYEPARSRALRAFLEGATVDRLTAPEQVVERRVRLDVPPLRSPETEADGKPVRHEAVLLVTAAEPDDPRPNQLVCMRGNRMVVMTQTINPPLGGNAYQALLLAGTAAGDSSDAARAAERFLRTAEPPEHDTWKRTEDLVVTYARGVVRSIGEFRSAMREGVLAVVATRDDAPTEDEAVPSVLREVLRIDAPKGPPRNARSHPQVDDVDGHVDDTGTWQVRVEVNLPPQADPWTLVPVLRFVTRSGPKPVVKWARLVAERNCEVTAEGSLLFKAGARTAVFLGESDVRDHPVPARHARVEVDVQRAKESM
ncbi:helix-turn-helix domain-containing protein [Streptomyces virginiae]|uniref:helix-turn-helix domain-containing protein n=1 Tax=Streptomyces virginiae TaxID=1961 RepID=UPI00225661A0|nr:helix-turn-helix transcriptional regulator [Streptomyces virginiae]MCX5271584.1 helix-turn-helix domain-containing protein [Streptomyces virginiae]